MGGGGGGEEFLDFLTPLSNQLQMVACTMHPHTKTSIQLSSWARRVSVVGWAEGSFDKTVLCISTWTVWAPRQSTPALKSGKNPLMLFFERISLKGTKAEPSRLSSASGLGPSLCFLLTRLDHTWISRLSSDKYLHVAICSCAHNDPLPTT